jgi:hypothetical protein
VQEMARFFRFVDQHSPQAEWVFLVLDSWFVHFHPSVLEYLAKQCPRIELVPLPTYARLSQSDGKSLVEALPRTPLPSSLR